MDEAMEITITLDKEDWRKFAGYLWCAIPRESRSCSKGFWFGLYYWMIASFATMLMYKLVNGFHWPTAGVASVLFVFVLLFFFLNYKRNKKLFEPSAEGAFVGKHKFIFDGKGIQLEGKGYESKYAWSAIRKVERAQSMILIYIDTAMVFVFPEAKLDRPDEFYNFITEQYSKSTGGRILG